MVVPYNIFDIFRGCQCGWMFHYQPNYFAFNSYALSCGLGEGTEALTFLPGDPSEFYPVTWDFFKEVPYDQPAKWLGFELHAFASMIGVDFDYDKGRVLVQQAFWHFLDWPNDILEEDIIFWNVRPSDDYAFSWRDPITVGNTTGDDNFTNPWGYKIFGFHDNSRMTQGNFKYGNGVWVTTSNEGGISRSTDGGETWELLTYPGNQVPPFASGVYEFEALTYGGTIPSAGITQEETDVWAVGGSYVARSLDGAETWEFSLVDTVPDFSGDPPHGWSGPDLNGNGGNMRIPPGVFSITYGNGVWIAGGFPTFANPKHPGTIQRNTDPKLSPGGWQEAQRLINDTYDDDYYEGTLSFKTANANSAKMKYTPRPGGGGRFWTGLELNNLLLYSDDNGVTWNKSFSDHSQDLDIEPGGLIDPETGLYSSAEYREHGDRMFYELGGFHPFLSWRDWPDEDSFEHGNAWHDSGLGLIEDIKHDPTNPNRIISVGRSWDRQTHPGAVYCISEDGGDTWGEVHDLPRYWTRTGTQQEKDPSDPSIPLPSTLSDFWLGVRFFLEPGQAEEYFNNYGAGFHDYDIIKIVDGTGKGQTGTVTSFANQRIIDEGLEEFGYIFVGTIDAWPIKPDDTSVYEFYSIDPFIDRVLSLCGELDREIEHTPIVPPCIDSLQILHYRFEAHDDTGLPLAPIDTPLLNAQGNQDIRLRIAVKNGTIDTTFNNITVGLDFLQRRFKKNLAGDIIEDVHFDWKIIQQTEYISNHNPRKWDETSWYNVVYPAMAFKPRLISEGYEASGGGLGFATDANLLDGDPVNRDITELAEIDGIYRTGSVDSMDGLIPNVTLAPGDVTELIFIIRFYAEIVNIADTRNKIRFRLSYIEPDDSRRIPFCFTKWPEVTLNASEPEYEVVAWEVNGSCNSAISLNSSSTAYAPETYLSRCTPHFDAAPTYHEVRVVIREKAGGYAGPRYDAENDIWYGDLGPTTYPEQSPPAWQCDICPTDCDEETEVLELGPPNDGFLLDQSSTISIWHGAHFNISVFVEDGDIVPSSEWIMNTLDPTFCPAWFQAGVYAHETASYSRAFPPKYASLDVSEDNNDIGDATTNDAANNCLGWSGSGLFISDNSNYLTGNLDMRERIRQTGAGFNDPFEFVPNSFYHNRPFPKNPEDIVTVIGIFCSDCDNPDPPENWEELADIGGCTNIPFLGYFKCLGYDVERVLFYGHDYAEFVIRFFVSDRDIGKDVKLTVDHLEFSNDLISPNFGFESNNLLDVTIGTVS